MKTLANCINEHVPKSKRTSVSENIKDKSKQSTKSGTKDITQALAIETILNELDADRANIIKSINKKLEKQVEPAKQVTEQEPVVDKPTKVNNLNEEITAPQEEQSKDIDKINLVRAFFAPFKIKGTNLLQTVPSFFQNLRSAVDNKLPALTEVFTDRNPLNADAQVLLYSLADFGVKFTQDLNNSVFRPKANKEYWYKEDALQYLAVDGKIPDNVAGTMAAIAYQYLSTRGKDTLFNDEQSIRGILGLKDSDQLTPEAWNLVKELGVAQNALKDDLGRGAFRLLGIKPSKDAPADLQQRLESALGLTIIATLEQGGLLKQKTIYTGEYSKNTKVKTNAGKFGIAGLKENIQNRFKPGFKPNDLNANNTWNKVGQSAVNDGKTVSVFYQVTPQTKRSKEGFLVENETVSNLQKIWRNSKRTWDQVFTGKGGKHTYSWEKVKHAADYRAKIKKTNQYATVEQTKNLQNTSDKPWIQSKNTMKIFLTMDRDTQLEIMGYTDPSTVHITERDNTVAANNALIRELDIMQDWLIDADKQPDGRDSEFFIQSQFVRNLRMHQTGDLKPQGSKLHRFVFSMREWNTSFKLNDPTMTKRFFQGIGQAFGIEAGKRGGLDGAIEVTKAKLKEPVIAEAVQAVRDTLILIGSKENTGPEAIMKIAKDNGLDKIILAGVKAGGEKVHTLKGLIEYARYLEAGKEFKNAKRRKGYDGSTHEFSTDITVEIDGMTNGPTLGLMQLMMVVDPEHLSTLRNAGISTSYSQGDTGAHLAAKYNMDSYEAPGMAWNEALLERETTLLKDFEGERGKNTQKAFALKNELSRLAAAKRLFQDFSDDNGYTSDRLRKLAKNPVMTTMYGSGTESLIKGLMETLIKETIYTKLQDIAKNKDADGLRNLRDDIQILANIPGNAKNEDKFFVGSQVADAQGNLIPKKVLELTIPDASLVAIYDSIKDNHGKALEAGIKSIYGDLMNARKPFNTGFGIVASLYNVARTNEIKERKAELIKSGELLEGFDLPLSEYAAIDEKLAAIFPTMPTTFAGGRMDMAKQDPERTYSDTDRVTQNYGKPGDKNNIPRKTAYLAKPNTVKSPGVSPFVMSIQSFDATISNMLQGLDLSVLNVHDGFFVGLNKIGLANNALNKFMYEVMDKANLLNDMQQAINDSIDAFAAYHKGKNLSEELVAEFKRMKITEITDNKTGKNIKIYDHYREAIKDIKNKMSETAEIATRNKKSLLDAITNVNNYYDPSGGYNTRNAEASQLGDVTPATLDALVKETVEKRAQAIKKQQVVNEAKYRELITEYVKTTLKATPSTGPAATTLKSSPNTALSDDPADYAIHLEVDQGNAVTTYDTIKNDSIVRDSSTHDRHLKKILFKVISRVIDPADLYLATTPAVDTAGKLNVQEGSKNKIFITSQPSSPSSGILGQSIKMSTGEVYVHELLHAVTQYGLKTNKLLRDQVQSIYELAKSSLTYEAFLDNPAQATADEIATAKDRYDYIFNKPAVTKTTKLNTATGLQDTLEFSAHLDEFVAFGLSNEQFGKALEGIAIDPKKLPIFAKSTWHGLLGDNIQDTLVRILDRIISVIMSSFNIGQPEGNAALELERLATKLGQINKQRKTLAADLIKKSDASTDKITGYINGKIREVFQRYPRLNLVQHGKTFGTMMANRNSPSGQVLRDIRAQFDGLNFGFGQAIVREINGLTDRLEPLHKLLNVKKQVIDRAREEAVTDMVSELGKLWDMELTSEEKVSLYYGIKTDMSMLREHFTFDQLKELVNDPGKIQAEITKIRQTLQSDPKLKGYVNYYERQARSLGHFLMHGKALEKGSFMNATIIAGLYNTSYEGKIQRADADRAEVLVDQMASLYAMSFNRQSKQLYDLMKDSPLAVEGVLELHGELKRQSREALFYDNPMKIMKGYTKDIINQRVEIIEAPASEEAALAAQGFVRSSKPIPRDPDDHAGEVYIYTARHGRVNDYRSTILSVTGNRKKGTTFSASQRQVGIDPINGGAVNSPRNRFHQAKQKALNDMFTQPMKPLDPRVPIPNYAIPAVDDLGHVTEYRYMMSEENKNTLLEKHNEYDAVMGAMAGQIVDKPNTSMINDRLINALKDMYDAEYPLRSNMYVEVSPFASDERYRNIYNMIPAAAREEIKQVWGENRMFVAKDVIDLAFGFRKYSIVEAFAKNPDDRAFLEKMIVSFAQQFLGKRHIEVTGSIEEILTDLTKLAKNNIVVRSISVTLNNFFSNLVFLKMNGVATGDIFKYWREASLGVVRYEKDKKALDSAELKLKITRGRKPTATLSQATIDATSKELEKKIRELKNEIAVNPATFLINSGLLQSIVDDVETSKIQSPYPGVMDTYIDKAVGYLPSPVVAAGKVAFLAKDTQAYKVLNNAVKMTDFIGRYIMYQHYTKTGPVADRLPHDKALAKVMHQFVNFNLPSHRMLEYGNEVGLVWFSKYALGILKPITQVLKEKPAETIMTFATAQSYGVSNIIESGLNDPLRVFSNPLGVFMETVDESLIVNPFN